MSTNLPDRLTIWIKLSQADPPRYKIIARPAGGYHCGAIQRSTATLPITPSYITVGATFFELPAYEDEVGYKPLCEHCQNQLACLSKNQESWLYPEDLRFSDD